MFAWVNLAKLCFIVLSSVFAFFEFEFRALNLKLYNTCTATARFAVLWLVRTNQHEFLPARTLGGLMAPKPPAVALTKL